MRKMFIFIAVLLASTAIAVADEKPIDVNSLPTPARDFLNSNFPGEKIIFATVEDELLYPDYNVVLSNGVSVEFYNDGALEKLECRTGIPEVFVPIQIVEFVKVRYPDAYFIEYNLDRRHYEVKLSNRLELKFNKNFNLLKIDD